MNHAGIASGIGGFELAANWMGWQNIFTSEIDPFCQRVLAKNFPYTIHYGDVKQINFTEHNGAVDVFSAGIPCQPFSKAGRMRGKDDPRYLWDEYIRGLRELCPRWTMAENVSGLLSTNGGADFENIVGEMESVGYEVLPLHLPSAIGQVPHIRERIWLVGRYFMETDSDTARGQLGELSVPVETQGAQYSSYVFGNDARLSWFQTISRIHRIRNGVSRRMDASRNRVLGNAIVPQIAYMLFRCIEQVEINIYNNQL